MQSNPTFYIVPMFPYPSGRLHMGHVRNYAISDAIARHYRRQGFEVLHPMGWDAFGLPAENAARATGADPRAWTDSNIHAMREQLRDLEFEFAPGHEIATHHPDYIRQGQSLFLKFYRAGLIERRAGEVWWDPEDHTVLANEQVINGRGWRSGAIVERRTLSMLFARTRDQAVELAQDLETVRWPHQAVAAQRAWIGVEEDEVRLRDWCLSRQRSWGTPVPLIECEQCGEMPADEAGLPLPNLPVQPSDQDVACACPQCGQAAKRSTETLDTFWDSAFYTYAYPGAREDRVDEIAGQAFQRFGQVDLYVGGLEHATMHLLYARWFARALREVGFDVAKEPFTRLIGQGMVCAPAYQAEDGQWIAPSDVVASGDGFVGPNQQPVRYAGTVKMSKSKKNGVDPAEQVAQFGAEAVRFAMLFAAPFAVEVDWTDEVISTAAKHLERMMAQAEAIGKATAGIAQEAIEQQSRELRQKARASYEGMDGVNAMMGTALGLWRLAQRAAREGAGDSARVAATAVADALWPVIPQTMTVVMRQIDPAWMPAPISAEDTATIKPMIFQVNGVKRAMIMDAVSSAEEAIEWVKQHRPETASQFLGGTIQRLVWVPGRVVNVVVGPIPKPRAPR